MNADVKKDNANEGVCGVCANDRQAKLNCTSMARDEYRKGRARLKVALEPRIGQEEVPRYRGQAELRA